MMSASKSLTPKDEVLGFCLMEADSFACEMRGVR